MTTPLNSTSYPRYQRAFILLVLCTAMLASFACGKRTNLRQTLQAQTVQGPERSPIVVAAYQPWFGRSGHINVGYSSQDRTVLEKQIEEARSLGISAFVVNWYGQDHQFEDRSYALLQSVAAGTRDFKIALMYDEDVDASDPTASAINDLNYAYQRYIAPQSPVSNAYFRYNTQPVIFIFPKGGRTDWLRVSRAVKSWPEKPALIYKDPVPKWNDAFDGFYAWVQPGPKGWAPDGSNSGLDYLDNFYQTMNSKFPEKIVVGGAWPGFNDSRASWSRNRKIDYRCGKVFEESLRAFRRYHGPQNPLPILMIETWNDYEEGTAIERGYNNCGPSSSSIIAGR
ncbi:MAG TPA: hypothetical protein VF786_03125 [Terriglobales bacterium]